MSAKSTLPVEQNGGMSVDQIHLTVGLKATELEKAWASRMDDYTNKIEKKLDASAEKLDQRLEHHAEKVERKLEIRDAFIDARFGDQDKKLDVILTTVQQQTVRHEMWHGQDLVYREGVQEWRQTQEPKIEQLVIEVPKIKQMQLDLNTRFNLIQWLVMFCKGISWTSEKAVSAAEKGRNLAVAVAAITGCVTATWAFFREGGMLSVIKTFINHHRH